MAFLSGVGAVLVAALDRFKVGGKLPESSLGNELSKLGDELVRRLGRKNLHGIKVDEWPKPTISDRMVNEVREVPGHVVGGLGRVATFGEFVVKALGKNPSERLQEELTRLEQELDRREVELGGLRGVVECSQIVLTGHKEVVDARVDLQEKGVVIVQILDEAAEFENLKPTAEQIDEFMGAFVVKFTALLADDTQFVRMRNLAILQVALNEEVVATIALEKQLAALTKQYERVVQRRERVNDRLERVNQQAGGANELLAIAARAAPPASPLRQVSAPRQKQRGAINGAGVPVETVT